jgi:hypothetical protein
MPLTRSFRPLRSALAAGLVLVLASGCDRDSDPVGPAPLPDDAVVFDDNLGEGIDFQAFGGSKLDAVQRDVTEAREGSASLRITVPAPDDPTGSYAGGAFVAAVPRNLTEYNAITFWAKASRTANLDVAGIGNDNTGTSLYTADVRGLPLTTTWQRYVIPFPRASVLDQERGLFYFAEGAEEGQGYTIWMDEIRFETVSGLSAPQPAIGTQELALEVGASATVSGTVVTFTLAGQEITVISAPSYFTFTSSDPGVATVSATGEIQVVGEGTATITAALGTVEAAGSVTVTTVTGPQEAAPTPTRDPADVISLFSNAYDDVTVDTWSAPWDSADLEDVQIGGSDVKRYSNLVFAGIEFTSQTIDASEMTHFHMDVWTPDGTDPPAAFRIKLVDFGADGVFGGGDDVEHEITLNSGTTPALVSGEWSRLEIPLSAFTGLTTRGHLAQLIISGDPNTVYVDNVYFFRSDEGEDPDPTPAPDQAPPAPAAAASDVISLFSNAYDNVTVDTWSAPWDNADVADVQIDGSDMKRYTNLVFAGIEFTSAPIDAREMTHFHLHVWTPDSTTPPAAFRIKLVDFGADGAFGGGDDVEHEITLDATTTPALVSGEWSSLDIPLSAFTGLTTRGAVAQLIISGDPDTVYLDNVYFRR